MSEKPIEEIPGWAYKFDEGVFPKNITEADELTVSIKTGFKYLFNVGSVGQPRNRDPRASFAVYDSDDKTVTRYRIPYDIASAQKKILAVGLPERLALRLETGN
jgi:diadenosine tetraphosphatase ApaH/serine/threonine PP2A family protein phosphatase